MEMNGCIYFRNIPSPENSSNLNKATVMNIVSEKKDSAFAELLRTNFSVLLVRKQNSINVPCNGMEAIISEIYMSD